MKGMTVFFKLVSRRPNGDTTTTLCRIRLEETVVSVEVTSLFSMNKSQIVRPRSDTGEGERKYLS